jgi:hypothetical protein
LSLAQWCDARRLVAQQGGPSCDSPGPSPSPPAPIRASDPSLAEPALARPARRRPPADASNAQPRHRSATRVNSEHVGGGE